MLQEMKVVGVAGEFEDEKGEWDGLVPRLSPRLGSSAGATWSNQQPMGFGLLLFWKQTGDGEEKLGADCRRARPCLPAFPVL
jgi:hypothetical protein